MERSRRFEQFAVLGAGVFSVRGIVQFVRDLKRSRNFPCQRFH